jgi:hypothetical protein
LGIGDWGLGIGDWGLGIGRLLNYSALHNCGMNLKTLPLCAFAPLRETKIIPLISNANYSS